VIYIFISCWVLYFVYDFKQNKSKIRTATMQELKSFREINKGEMNLLKRWFIYVLFGTIVALSTYYFFTNEQTIEGYLLYGIYFGLFMASAIFGLVEGYLDTKK
jgi:multisubunit Na+/H+ antiporter MnhB subunit